MGRDPVFPATQMEFSEEDEDDEEGSASEGSESSDNEEEEKPEVRAGVLSVLSVMLTLETSLLETLLHYSVPALCLSSGAQKLVCAIRQSKQLGDTGKEGQQV